MNAPYLSGLNAPQLQAVQSLDGAVLVLSGAGTGKTRVLTARIAHILYTKAAYASQVLAVTFTNKAAREMVERVRVLLHQDDAPEDITRGMWLGTFHSIAARILRRHADLVGLNESYTILDTDDQLRLIKTLMKEQKIEDKAIPAKVLLDVIQHWKDAGLTPKHLTAEHVHPKGDIGLAAQRIYTLYQQRLRAVNACDFGDLMLHNLTIFTNHPDVLRHYAQKFRYILVDEYQDTNIGQYLWLRMLAMGHKNICCVGDDDQSIYGWRGAEVGNILKFEKDFPGSTIVRLEQNYRSTGHILAAASGLITHNRERLGKSLWTDGDQGEAVRIKSVWDDMEEARFVGEEIEAHQRDGISLNNMAILVRAGFQTRSFEERFITLGVAYQIIGGLRFYERLEIRDAIAYLRMIQQPRDDLAFERIINTPKRGVGKATLELLHTRARSGNMSLMEALGEALQQGAISGKARISLGAFYAQWQRWHAQLDTPVLPSTLLHDVLEESGYLQMWKDDKTPEAPGRLENLRELERALADFSDVGAFLEHISLVMDRDDKDTGEKVTLMSLHAAKGLEFDTVFLTGWEEGLFPHQRALDTSGTSGLEEERRLAYVGITRARRCCYITHAANRRMYNQWQASAPSRFLRELPEAHVEHLDGRAQAGRSTSPQLFQRGIESLLAEHRVATGAGNAVKISSTTASSSFKGKRIFHQKFGYGMVLVDDNGNLDISFDKAGRKKIMADYVALA